MKRTRTQEPAPEGDDVVLLEDLAPMRDVRGGADKLRFGQSLPAATAHARLPNEESATPRSPERRVAVDE